MTPLNAKYTFTKCEICRIYTFKGRRVRLQLSSQSNKKILLPEPLSGHISPERGLRILIRNKVVVLCKKNGVFTISFKGGNKFECVRKDHNCPQPTNRSTRSSKSGVAD